ncbi:hypothetical protein BpHYR1_029655, partial [Brachionus plicatilis]
SFVDKIKFLGFFEEIADGQINACKSTMFETGDYEVSCLFRNCSIILPMQAEWLVLELSLWSCRTHFIVNDVIFIPNEYHAGIKIGKNRKNAAFKIRKKF